MALLALTLGAQAQDGYQITGKTTGIDDGKVYLISCNTDTLGVTDMKKGLFVFSGKVDTPDVAYIRTEKGTGMIPLMLENTNFQILAGPSGVKVVGGESQQAMNDYQALVDSTQRAQEKVQQEMQAAYQEGNQMKMQGITKPVYEVCGESTPAGGRGVWQTHRFVCGRLHPGHPHAPDARRHAAQAIRPTGR